MAAAKTEETKADADLAALAKTVEALRKDLAALADSVSKVAAHGAETAEGLAENAAARARAAAADIGGAAKARVEEAEQDLIASVRKDPVRAVLIALGLGLLIGILTRR